MAAGLLAGLVAAALFGLGTPPELNRLGQVESLRAVRRSAVAGGLQYGALAAVSLASTLWLTVGVDAVPRAVGSGFVVVGVAAFLACGGWPWLRYKVVTMSLARAGLLPWRLWRFLDDAHVRGVLRKDGVAWQFRHAVLHDELADDGHDQLRYRWSMKTSWLGDARNMAQDLARRGRYDWAEQILRRTSREGWPVRWRLLLPGDQLSFAYLIDVLAATNRLDEAIELFHRVPTGAADGHLADALVAAGCIDELVRQVDQPYAWPAFADRYDSWLAAQGDITGLAHRAASGADRAQELLIDHWADSGAAGLPHLKALAQEGNWHATERLVQVLTRIGDLDQALAYVRPPESMPERSHATRQKFFNSFNTEENSTYGVVLLARRLRESGRIQDAVNILQPRVAIHDSMAEKELAFTYAKFAELDQLRDLAYNGRRLNDGMLSNDAEETLAVELGKRDAVDELREMAAVSYPARRALAEILVRHGQLDELQARAKDDQYAARVLAEALGQRGQLPTLRRLAAAGDAHAARVLTGVFVQQGNPDEAIRLLYRHYSANAEIVAIPLAELLVGQNRHDEAAGLLRVLADQRFAGEDARKWLDAHDE